MKNRLVALLATLITSIFLIEANGQMQASPGSAEIYAQLKKLNVLGSVLYIAAHPDDENTRLLAFLAKEKMYRTGYLSLTRGDGGQNLIGDEQGVDLGLIRTQELLAARRIDGAEQFFSRAYDFGFSKSAEEAMRLWEKDKILSDVVWVIRTFQPDVIITRFPGDERAGHGHHAASALLANEAFSAAADPNRFPEQMKYGVKPWQAKRILWNTFNFGGNNTTAEDQFKLDVGTYNALLGKGYGEIAAESRSQHKSQGFGVPRQRGVSLEYFKTTGGDAPKEQLLDGVTPTWDRIAGGTAISHQINTLINGYSFEHPEQSVAGLIELYKQLSNFTASYWRSQKLKEVQQLIEACSGLYAEAVTSQSRFAPGDSIAIAVTINKRNNAEVTLQSVALKTGNDYAFSIVDTTISRRLPVNENVVMSFAKVLSDTLSPTQPYWLRNDMSSGSFNIPDQLKIGKAESDPVLTCKMVVQINDEQFLLQRPVQYKFTDPVKGELFQPLVIMPKATVHPDHPLLIEHKDAEATVRFHYTANATGKSEAVVLDKHLFAEGQSFAKGDSKAFERVIGTSAGKDNSTSLYRDTFMMKDQPAVYPVDIRYDHIPPITYFKKAVQTVVRLDVQTKGKRIGYITGAGDKVPQALEQMGFTVTRLGENDIETNNLKQFDAVIAGVRAYNVNGFLKAQKATLMEYVQNGGNLIVQYNTSGSAVSGIGPYPFDITRNRITDEAAPVSFAVPNHPALNYPNKITAADFEHWIQERSIYMAEKIDSNYAAPLSMADPGEKPSNGSLIIAPYGKGNYVYTGLVFFRELPAGVPGAYRLMANLIALPKRK